MIMDHVALSEKDEQIISAIRNEFKLDNSYVVPYNHDLILAFIAHINVEYCGYSMLIKYMFKYISKGTDRVFARVYRAIGKSSIGATPSPQVIDEIQNYVKGRFICAHEAYWRILKFDIHCREPTVQILAMHLKDMQRITFRDKDRLKSMIDLPGKKSTSLTEWFAFNEDNEMGRHLSYLEFPSEYWRLYLFTATVSLLYFYHQVVPHIPDLNSPKNTQLGKLLADADLIIWDEAPMNDRRCFEALDRSLRDIVVEPSSLFGGKLVLLGGDFRETLPVKKGASKIEVIASCISESVLWSSFKVFTLKDNMRFARPRINLEERILVNSFASWLLDIGDGKIGEPAKEDPENTSWVHIPPAYCLPADEQDIINSKVMDMVPSESTIYISQDEATPTRNDGAETEMLYPIEHLNTFKLPSFPPHQLELKVDAPVMLLRNVNIAGGLCNGMRIIVRQLMTKLIEVQIITGTRVGEKVLTIKMEISTISELNPNSRNKTIEVKVYRKWIAKSPPEMTPYAFCCILLDREGKAIQANMALKDTDYFDAKIEMRKDYQISNFSCEATNRFQQTLENETSIRFGKYTNSLFLVRFLQPAAIKATKTRLHWENTIADDNSLSLAISLTTLDALDQLAISIVMETQIQDKASGEKLKLKTSNIHSMEKPVIIAISSCRVSKYTDYQLSASLATYYYLNPKIPEAEESLDLFKARYEDSPPLTICKTLHKDVQQDKTRNRLGLTNLHKQPHGVRFTAEATITGINMNKDWYYIFCHQCGKAAITNGDDQIAMDSRPTPVPVLRTDREIQASRSGKNTTRDSNSTRKTCQDHSTRTASSASTATNQSTKEEENTQKDKEKCTAKEGEVTPPPTQSTVTGAMKNNEQSDRPQGTSAKKALFDQQSTESKKHNED
ncbi:DNA helicase [Tanacetum coccineum]